MKTEATAVRTGSTLRAVIAPTVRHVVASDTWDVLLGSGSRRSATGGIIVTDNAVSVAVPWLSVLVAAAWEAREMVTLRV